MAEDLRLSSIEFRTIERLPGYRFGSDGSAWTCWKRDEVGKPYTQSSNWKQLRLIFMKSNNYPYVNLKVDVGKKRMFHLHRLILEAFVGPCPLGMEARHFPDNNPKNCAISNLSWGTKSQNMGSDRLFNGTLNIGDRHPMRKLSSVEVLKIRSLRESGVSPYTIASDFGVTYRTVYSIVTRETWRHI